MAGRKSFQPTEHQKGEVTALTVAGYTEDQVAQYLDIDPKTLRKHFRKELDHSMMRVLGNCTKNVIRMANGYPAQYDDNHNCIRAEQKPDLGANCFLLKTRGKALGWTERHEVTGEGGKAIPLRIDSLTDAQLNQLIDRVEPS